MAAKLVIVGGGPAGCACAIEAVAAGLEVLLVDEHPQSPASMGFDAPYFYGTRLDARLSDDSAMADAVLGANELLMESLEAGVDVLTSTVAWGVFGPDAGDPATRCRQVGLADAERSWLVPYDYLVLAPGARDLVLSFPNWDLPGVLGVKGAATLLLRYGALGGRRLVILGSGNAGLALARDGREAGLEIAAIVEAGSKVVGNVDMAAELESAGIPILLSHTICEAVGQAEVSAALIAPIAPDGSIDPASVREIACDTICMAFGSVPNVELTAVAGCALEFEPLRGGWVPVLSAAGETSVENIFVIGDGAGICDAAVLGDSSFRDQGSRVARVIAARAGLSDGEEEEQPQTDDGAAAYPPNIWLEAMLAAAGEDVILCQCEEVTRRAMLDLAPPRYLSRGGEGKQGGGVAKLAEASQRSQDAIKRLTRVGMGHCQGRRCRDHGAMLLAKASAIDLSQINPGSYRMPVRPLPVSIMAAEAETPEMASRWPYWLWEAESIPEI
jgi:NADPH-dependent 2,4-dienoyl-CoA reductase/sulfur reductase-like enzyme